MKIKDFFNLIAAILKDWRVLVTLAAMLFVMWAANFILTYKKKPRKKKKGKTPAEPPKPAEEKKEEAKEETSEK